MYLTEHFGLSLPAMVVWGLMMAFFFNAFLWIANAKRNNVLLMLSLVVFASYFTSDHLFSWFDNSSVYLSWAIYDVITLAVIFSCTYFIKGVKSPAFTYVIFVLCSNTILQLLMYYDLHITGNVSPWFLWDFYSFTVYLLDFTMIIALIVDRDILGLNTLKNRFLRIGKSRHLQKQS